MVPSIEYTIIPCHIIVLKWQNHLKVGTDKRKLKVKMQSVSDDDVWKRFLEKPLRNTEVSAYDYGEADVTNRIPPDSRSAEIRL